MPSSVEHRKIKVVYFPNNQVIKSGEDKTLVMVTKIHTEMQIFERWIVLFKGEDELAWYNPRYVESIEWEPKNDKKDMASQDTKRETKA